MIDRVPRVTLGGDGAELLVPPLRVGLPITVRHGRSDVGAQAEASTLSWTLIGLPDEEAPVQVGRLVRLAVHAEELAYVDSWVDVWDDVWGLLAVTDVRISTRFVGQITDLETSREGDHFTTSVTAAGVMSAWAAGEPTGAEVPGSRGVPSRAGDGLSAPTIERFLPQETEAGRTQLALASRNLAADPTLTSDEGWDEMGQVISADQLISRDETPWDDPADQCCRQTSNRAYVDMPTNRPRAVPVTMGRW